MRALRYERIFDASLILTTIAHMHATTRPTTRQVMLGLFIVWQIIFLVAANLLRPLTEYLDRAKVDDASVRALDDWVHIRDVVRQTEAWFDRWVEMTEQPQAWSLFAPNVSANVTFHDVEFRWDEPIDSPNAFIQSLSQSSSGHAIEGAVLSVVANTRIGTNSRPPIWLASDNKPADVNSFFRIGKFRLRRVETNDLYVILTRHGYRADEVTADWRQRIRRIVADEAGPIQAYLRWRWEVLRGQRKLQEPPRQVVLWVQNYRIPAPPGPTPWTWEGPEDKQPIARWLIIGGSEEAGGICPPLRGVLQGYDPAMGRFVPMEDR